MNSNIFEVLNEESDEQLPDDLIIEEYMDYSDSKLNVIKNDKHVIIRISDLKENLLEINFEIENYRQNKFVTKNINIMIPRRNINHTDNKNILLYPIKFLKKDYNDIIYSIKKKKDCRFYLYNDSNNLSVSFGYSEEKNKIYISCSFEYGESDGPIQMFIFELNHNYEITDELKKVVN
jgi:pectate lyase